MIVVVETVFSVIVLVIRCDTGTCSTLNARKSLPLLVDSGNGVSCVVYGSSVVVVVVFVVMLVVYC